jgi:hypothetical protein
MNRCQRATFESLKRRVVEKTCRIRTAELTRQDAEPIGPSILVHLAAESGLFKGTIIGSIGPRGGLRLTHERYDFY